MRNTRRALLLFAIVLGVSAIVAAVFQPPRGNRRERPPRGPASGQRAQRPSEPAPDQATLRFDAAKRGGRGRARVGEATTIDVRVPRPGEVELPAMGLVAAAEPLTPASFQVSPDRAGIYNVIYTPAGAEQRRVGVLVVRP